MRKRSTWLGVFLFASLFALPAHAEYDFDREGDVIYDPLKSAGVILFMEKWLTETNEMAPYERTSAYSGRWIDYSMEDPTLYGIMEGQASGMIDPFSSNGNYKRKTIEVWDPAVGWVSMGTAYETPFGSRLEESTGRVLDTRFENGVYGIFDGDAAVGTATLEVDEAGVDYFKQQVIHDSNAWQATIDGQTQIYRAVE